jgi:oligopeptide transport system ATP-binding protein
LPKLVEIRNLTTRFYTHEGVVQAVNGVSFAVDAGEIVGIVGESGCGKSVSMLSIMRLIPEPPGKIEKGEVLFEGRNLLDLSEQEMEKLRGCAMAMIFQDPMTSLNPTLTIGFQITEALKLHQGLQGSDARRRAVDLLAMVGIPRAEERLSDYPHLFSGGMRQRAMIAIALSCNPSLLIADEPTTALDVTVQAQIIDLVKRLQEKLEMTVIWITHDLGVVARLVDRVMVMYAGYIIEDAQVDDLFASPRHPYTLGLLGSLPRPGNPPGARLNSIPGQPPSLVDPPPGCPFVPRCDYVSERCQLENPVLETVGANHRVACWEYQLTEGS